MFLSVGHEKNVIYSKLVNNPFNVPEYRLIFWAHFKLKLRLKAKLDGMNEKYYFVLLLHVTNKSVLNFLHTTLSMFKKCKILTKKHIFTLEIDL